MHYMMDFPKLTPMYNLVPSTSFCLFMSLYVWVFKHLKLYNVAISGLDSYKPVLDMHSPSNWP